ncbi:thiamine pyrophosphate-dependent enzyme [Dyadobacter jiangsuensis]|uniref:Acetolactate synthase-1/2/3 large subunit n=1 Tax=Dyadobacter jiangsuensis TaxID=1591085 RepID=A0A2P8GJ82_9BACT|nr:thiamine pyrophosphate-dependent enzyme [Dyadobacter jiangsuensis]PSL34025.1 acetolactate synthase-1/2/3 large subunit [Dyadobacter jiangsuensis]
MGLEARESASCIIELDEQFNLDSYQIIITTLSSWGIRLYAGVNGGGVIHLLKHLAPLDRTDTGMPSLLTIGEYTAGFIPLGYYLASGRIAASVATTGAATKLICCGLSDAKLHDIPAVYIVPVSNGSTAGFSPLQDTTEHGSNILMQLRAELPESVFVLDSRATLNEQLSLAKEQLDRSKPVVLVLDNEGLSISQTDSDLLPTVPNARIRENHCQETFLTTFRRETEGKRVVLFVGEEMARYPHAADLTTRLSEVLQAAVIWSINGANAVSRNNPYGYGYISFGGNDRAVSLYHSLGEQDVLLVIGACPDEYTVNFRRISAAATFHLSNIPQAYGLVDNSLQHVVDGRYYRVNAPLDSLLQTLADAATQLPFVNIPAETAPPDLNDQSFARARGAYADMAALYQHLDRWWPKGSIGIDDTCLAYKDRQYVTQRPNNHIRFFSLYRGSAMGGAFGVAIGAKLADPGRQVFLFTGDGCFRLFSGSLGEVSHLGLVVFLLNNETFGIVEQGLRKVLPDIGTAYYHSRLGAVDYCAIARANNWDGIRLTTDLSNLDEILRRVEAGPVKSLLIEVPVDPNQVLGKNPRLKNL